MSAWLILLFAFALLVLLMSIGMSRSERAVLRSLEGKGKLCLGTVLSYDGDGQATVEFLPADAKSAIHSLGIGPFKKSQFPPGSMVAVLYNPLCPAINSVVAARTDEALRLLSKVGHQSATTRHA